MYVTLYHPHIFSGWDSPKGQTTISHRGGFARLRRLTFIFILRCVNSTRVGLTYIAFGAGILEWSVIASSSSTISLG